MSDMQLCTIMKRSREARERHLLSRVAIYGCLCLFAFIYIAPLVVVVLNSFRTNPEIAANGMMAWPNELRLDAWPTVWGTLLPQWPLRRHGAEFLELGLYDNSRHTSSPRCWVRSNGYILVEMAFQRVRHAFHIDAVWCVHAGANRLDAVGLYARHDGPQQNHVGTDPRACHSGHFLHHAVCRNFYVNIPDDLIKAARIDGAGFWRIFRKIILPLSPPILIVTVIWQFTGIWNEFLYGVVLTTGKTQPVTAAVVPSRSQGKLCANSTS